MIHMEAQVKQNGNIFYLNIDLEIRPWTAPGTMGLTQTNN